MYQLTEKGLQTLQTYDSVGEEGLRLSGMTMIVPVLESIHASPDPSFKQIMQDTGLSHYELMGVLGSSVNHGYISPVGHRVKHKFRPPTKEELRKSSATRYKRYPELESTLSSEQSKEKYWSNPEYRKSVLERNRARDKIRRSDPQKAEEIRAKKRENYRKRKLNPQWAEAQVLKRKEKYEKERMDPKRVEASRASYAKWYKRKRLDPEWIEKERTRTREYYWRKKLEREG